MKLIFESFVYILILFFTGIGKVIKAAINNPYFSLAIGLVATLSIKEDIDGGKAALIIIGIILAFLLDGMHSIEKAIQENTKVSEQIVREQQVIHLTEGGDIEKIIQDKLAKFRATANKSSGDASEHHYD